MNLTTLELVTPKPWRKDFPRGPFTYAKLKRFNEARTTMTVFIGPPRTGKSTAASTDGENCSLNRPYRAKDVTFLPQDYIHEINHAQSGDQKQFDEPAAEWSNRAFMSVKNKMLNATHITFASKLIFVDWAVPVFQMEDKVARMLVNYTFSFRDTGPRGISKFYKNWVDAYTGKTGRTGLGSCWWADTWQDRPEERKEYLEMKKNYQDRSYSKYYKEFSKSDDEHADKAKAAQEAVDKAILDCRANPEPFKNSRGKFDRDYIRRQFHLKDSDARYVADLLNKEGQGSRR